MKDDTAIIRTSDARHLSILKEKICKKLLNRNYTSRLWDAFDELPVTNRKTTYKNICKVVDNYNVFVTACGLKNAGKEVFIKFTGTSLEEDNVWHPAIRLSNSAVIPLGNMLYVDILTHEATFSVGTKNGDIITEEVITKVSENDLFDGVEDNELHKENTFGEIEEDIRETAGYHSKAAFNDGGRNDYTTERPEPKKEINWQEWEGKEIEVSFDCSVDSWGKRFLEKYNPKKENPFICEKEHDRNNYFSWPYARVIKEKEPEIDWSLVPCGTKVKGSDTSVLHASEWDDDYIRLFLKYIPESPYPFYMFAEGEIEEAMGWTYCALAEPCKPEWLKKDNN